MPDIPVHSSICDQFVALSTENSLLNPATLFQKIRFCEAKACDTQLTIVTYKIIFIL